MCLHLTISEVMITTFQRTELGEIVLQKREQKYTRAAQWRGEEGHGKPELKYQGSAIGKGKDKRGHRVVLSLGCTLESPKKI